MIQCGGLLNKSEIMKTTLPVTDSVSSRVSKALRKAASRRFHAFTLAELIVVIAILAILATVGFLALSGYSRDAKESAARANSRSVQTAISSESAVTGNSPRYYVVHDPAAALSGAFVFVDGTKTFLTGGDWDDSGTNYSAGSPDYAKLKLDPEKFRTSFSRGVRFSGSVRFPTGVPSGSASSAYDAADLAVGAVDFVRKSGGKDRTESWIQVVAIPPAGGTVAVSGTFPV